MAFLLSLGLFKSRNRLIIVTPWSAHCTAHRICSQLLFCSLFCAGNTLLLEQVSVRFTTKILYQICSQLFLLSSPYQKRLLLEQVSKRFLHICEEKEESSQAKPIFFDQKWAGSPEQLTRQNRLRSVVCRFT